MSACPFCQEPMRATFVGGLREECEGYGAVWVEGKAPTCPGCGTAPLDQLFR